MTQEILVLPVPAGWDGPTILENARRAHSKPIAEAARLINLDDLRELFGRTNYEDNSDQAGDIPWEGLEEEEKEGWRAEHESCIEVVKQKLGIE